MNRKHILFLSFFSGLMCFSGSCKKIDQKQTEYTRLLREWKLVKTATDDNGNGMIDANEYHLVQDNFEDIYTFNGDSTGNEKVTANSVTTVYQFTWFLSRDTLQLNMTGHNTIKYYLYDISSTYMHLYNYYTTLGVAGYYYERK